MLVLKKFGGSSVADLDRIRACADRCLRTAAEGHQVVVVVSAMQGETNRLIALANALVRPEADPAAARGHYVEAAKSSQDYDRELDQLVATGETVSAALLAMAIGDRGGRAVSLCGHQLGMQTDQRHTRARILQIDEARIRSALDEGRIVVCAGFQGVDPDGNITTLGRGGSDTSAVALAAALKADVCEILTDVDGVYTTDPRIVPQARKIDRISYDEMLELASLGAKVLQIRSVAFAKKYGVRVHVRSSLNTTQGTWIVPPESAMESVVVSGVALERGEAKVTVLGALDVPGVIATVFGALGAAGIVVDMIIQNVGHDGRTDITFTVHGTDLTRALDVLAGVTIGGEAMRVETDRNIAKISIVGLGMRTHAEIVGQAFQILAAEGINVQMVSNSEIRLSIVVQERYGELALRALHRGLGLDGDRA